MFDEFVKISISSDGKDEAIINVLCKDDEKLAPYKTMLYDEEDLFKENCNDKDTDNEQNLSNEEIIEDEREL